MSSYDRCVAMNASHVKKLSKEELERLVTAKAISPDFRSLLRYEILYREREKVGRR